MSAAQDKRKTLNAIIDLKRALAVASDGSESDDSIAYPSNRGRKLKRKARFVHEGALNDAKGPRTYKEEIEYFGKRRKIIWRKEKPRKTVEEKEDESSEDSDDDEEGSGEDDADPYADVKLDKILAPLESAADLPSHPSLAHIYTNTTLNELLQQSLDKLCEEHEHTMKLKNLLTVFLGDDPYVNLEKMSWENEDYAAIARERGQMLLRELGALPGSESMSARESISGPSGTKDMLPDDIKVPNAEGNTDEDTEMDPPNGTSSTTLDSHSEWPSHPEDSHNPPPDAPPEEDPDATQEYKMEEIMADSPPPPPPRRMTTRSAHNSLHPTPPALSPAPPTHPVEIDAFFYPPNYSVDRNFGLPPLEAEDTRRLLATAVQRQDEFLRGLSKVRDGLLRAERLRKYVWGWCRAMEGTREYMTTEPGEKMDEENGYALSDGEDWYDPEAWGLEDVLEKGKEEEDEGVGEQVVQGKKTRGRRTVGN